MPAQDPDRAAQDAAPGKVAEGTYVTKGARLGASAHCSTGPGTAIIGEDVVADRPGIVRYADRQVRVVPPPPARRRRGQTAATDAATGTLATAREATGKAAHRHGVGKHGRLRGKTKKGFGDQGTWD